MTKDKKNGAAKRLPKTKVVDDADKPEMRRVEPSQIPLPSGARILHYINSIKGFNGKIGHYTGQRRNALKAAKAEGIDPSVVTDAIRLENQDPLEYRSYLEQLGVALKVTAHQVQLSVFDIAYDSPEDQARAEAKAAAKSGRSPECRWQEGSPAYDAYMDEYQKVQAAMVPGAQSLSQDQIDEAVREGQLT